MSATDCMELASALTFRGAHFSDLPVDMDMNIAVVNKLLKSFSPSVNLESTHGKPQIMGKNDPFSILDNGLDRKYQPHPRLSNPPTPTLPLLCCSKYRTSVYRNGSNRRGGAQFMMKSAQQGAWGGEGKHCMTNQ